MIEEANNGECSPLVQQIYCAMGEKKMVRFLYDGGLRIVEPHCHGWTVRGNEAIRAYQTEGYSSSGTMGWKTFLLDKMEDFEVLEENFNRLPECVLAPSSPEPWRPQCTGGLRWMSPELAAMRRQMSWSSWRGFDSYDEDEEVNEELVRAVQERRVVRFMYAGGLRVAEPHCYGWTLRGNEVIRAYQTEGDSFSGTMGWKLFFVMEMMGIVVLDEYFDVREGFAKGDAGMFDIYCEVDEQDVIL